MITKETVREILDTMFDRLADEVATLCNERGIDTQQGLMHFIRLALRHEGSAVDAQAVIAYLAAREPGIKIEAVGRNDEMGYVWARTEKGKRMASGLFGDNVFRRIEDPLLQYFVPGDVVVPTEAAA